jgi:hypothetical protein
MHDILDSRVSPTWLGMITEHPACLAEKARKALRRFAVPTTLFLDRAGAVYAQPAAYANNHPVDEIIGIYGASICAEDLADDLRATATARLAAIGILENWPDACQPA